MLTYVPTTTSRGPVLSTRKLVQLSMLAFAFLLPFLTWVEAAGCAILALVFNLFVLPHLDVDLRKDQGTNTSRPNLLEAGALPAKGDSGESVRRGLIIYPISVLALILFYRHDLYVVGGAWAIMALGDSTAAAVGTSVSGPMLLWNRAKTWTGFFGFVVVATVGAYILTRWVNPRIPADKALIVCFLGAVVGALVESAPISLDDNVSVPLVVGAFMYCAFLMEMSALYSNLPYLRVRLVLAIAVNLVLAMTALGLKMVSRSGAAVGIPLGVAVYIGYGYKSFLLMFLFFVLGSVATRLGYAKKAARGVAEYRKGARSWREAAANSLAGAFFAILVITTHHEAAFLMALIAAFAEAAGDTVSSEIGQWISSRAYLITTFKPVPAGENGGVSLGGSIAGFAATTMVVGAGFGLGLCGKGGALIALTGAVAGNVLDSLLGATLERRGLVTNGIVNFASTSFAGAVALSIALHMGY